MEDFEVQELLCKARLQGVDRAREALLAPDAVEAGVKAVGYQLANKHLDPEAIVCRILTAAIKAALDE